MTGQELPQPEPTKLDPQERTAFLQRQGWKADLPEPERMAIEQKWPDEAIEEALFHGF